MALNGTTSRGPSDGGNFEYEWSDTYLAAHVISDVGCKRERNEDSCALCAPSETGVQLDLGFTFAVADGMGGASAGERASSLALDAYVETFYAVNDGTLPQHIRGSIEEANRRVYEDAERNPEYHGMGTTLSTLAIAGDCAYVGQVGDSRVYVKRADADLLQITDDHSLVAEQVRGGLISEEEARTHSLKNLITRAIGIKEAVEIDLFSLRLEKGDTILMCSDGLCNMVMDGDISRALQLGNLQASARLLVGKALEAGGADNVSVALVRVVDDPPRVKMQEGCAAVATPSAGVLGRLKRLFS